MKTDKVLTQVGVDVVMLVEQARVNGGFLYVIESSRVTRVKALEEFIQRHTSREILDNFDGKIVVSECKITMQNISKTSEEVISMIESEEELRMIPC